MRRFVIAVLAAIAGYVAGAVAGYFAIIGFSSNTHDRSLEAAMTAAFAFGPLGALAAIAAAMIYTRPGPTSRGGVGV